MPVINSKISDPKSLLLIQLTSMETTEQSVPFNVPCSCNESTYAQTAKWSTITNSLMNGYSGNGYSGNGPGAIITPFTFTMSIKDEKL